MKKGELSVEQMKAPSRSLQRLLSDSQGVDPYINLANAIVSVAADDYRTALRDNNEKLQGNLEQFFYSGWFSILAKVEPDTIVAKLKMENDNEAPHIVN